MVFRSGTEMSIKEVVWDGTGARKKTWDFTQGHGYRI